MVTPRVTKDEENKAIQEELEKGEAGVADLLEFYCCVEAVYTSASEALEEPQITATTSSTNLE